MSRFAAFLALLLAVAVTACGGDPAADDVAKAYNDFAHDVVKEDYVGACALMTKQARAQVLVAGRALAGAEAKRCDDSLATTMRLLDGADLDALARKAVAADVTVTGNDATVKAHGDTSRLTRRDGRWLVADER